MWAFKQLHDKGLVYQGFKVLPYCWRCETPLSNHELRMDNDVYAERKDPSVTVRFKLETGEWLLAWSTTPWTLPSNLACAVGERDQVRGPGARRRALHPGRGPAGRLQAELAGGDPGGDPLGQGSGRPQVHAAVQLPGRHRAVRHRRRLAGHHVGRREYRGGHRRRAHGARLRRDGRGSLQRRGHPDRAHRGRPGQVHPGRVRLRGLHVFDANKPIVEDAEGAGQPGPAGDLRALLPALLALPEPADLQGGVELVRRGDQVQGPDGRAERADHLGPRPMSRMASSASGWRTQGLVDQQEQVLGFPDPGLAERRPELPAHRCVRLAGRA